MRIVAPLVLTGIACGSIATSAWARPPRAGDGVIHGTSDLQPIEALSGRMIYDKAKAVARVEGGDGVGFCSGFRVGTDLFLTNYHCFDYKPCDDFQFHLGFERGLTGPDELVFRCRTVLAKNLAYDYALYRVDFQGTLGDHGAETKVVDAADLGTGMTIPDNNDIGVDKYVDADVHGVVSKVKAHVRIVHSRPNDLKVALISPDGTIVPLVGRQEVHSDVFDVTVGMSDGLSKFKGEDAKGPWALHMADSGTGTKGRLEEFTLTVTTNAPDYAGQRLLTAEDYPIATLWTGDIRVGEKLAVPGHPNARPKEISTSDKCVFLTVKPELVEKRNSIHHMCDTEGGSSGSPLLDRATGEVVALHWGGLEDYNLAIPISLVVEDLRANISAADFADLHIDSGDRRR